MDQPERLITPYYDVRFGSEVEIQIAIIYVCSWS